VVELQQNGRLQQLVSGNKDLWVPTSINTRMELLAKK
jgi:hypothetical protein